MILECPLCNNRYLVDKRAIGPSGRTVRCAKCKHQWHAAPPEREEAKHDIPLEAASPEIRPIPEGSSVPVIPSKGSRRSWKAAGALAASFILFLLVSAVYFRPLVLHVLPVSGTIYNTLGMYDTTGIVMAEIAYHKEGHQKEGPALKDLHRITGYFVNTGPEPRHLPMLNIELVGKEGTILKSRRLSESYMLAPGESREFSQVIESSPNSVHKIIVELGNKMDLLLR
jgi:predicted Zn finger-like uncharacterized protein